MKNGLKIYIVSISLIFPAHACPGYAHRGGRFLDVGGTFQPSDASIFGAGRSAGPVWCLRIAVWGCKRIIETAAILFSEKMDAV